MLDYAQFSADQVRALRILDGQKSRISYRRAMWARVRREVKAADHQIYHREILFSLEAWNAAVKQFDAC